MAARPDMISVCTVSVEICATFISSEGLRILGPVYMEEGCPG